MAENSGIFESELEATADAIAKRRNNIPRREAAKHEIHRLRVRERLTVSEISDMLKIPKRTVERYLHEIYEQDDMLLLRPTAEQVLTDRGIYLDQLIQRSKDLQKIIDDPNVDADIKIAAHNLGAKLDRAVFLSAYESPVNVVHNMRATPQNKPLLKEDNYYINTNSIRSEDNHE